MAVAAHPGSQAVTVTRSAVLSTVAVSGGTWAAQRSPRVGQGADPVGALAHERAAQAGLPLGREREGRVAVQASAALGRGSVVEP